MFLLLPFPRFCEKRPMFMEGRYDLFQDRLLRCLLFLSGFCYCGSRGILTLKSCCWRQRLSRVSTRGLYEVPDNGRLILCTTVVHKDFLLLKASSCTLLLAFAISLCLDIIIFQMNQSPNFFNSSKQCNLLGRCDWSIETFRLKSVKSTLTAL